MKIRTVTVGIPDAFSREQLQFAVDFNRRCRGRFEANGYEVQTTRVNSQVWGAISSIDQVLELDCHVVELGGEFFSLGTIFPHLPQTPAHLALVPDAISQSRTLFTSATLTTPRSTDWGGKQPKRQRQPCSRLPTKPMAALAIYVLRQQ